MWIRTFCKGVKFSTCGKLFSHLDLRVSKISAQIEKVENFLFGGKFSTSKKFQTIFFRKSNDLEHSTDVENFHFGEFFWHLDLRVWKILAQMEEVENFPLQGYIFQFSTTKNSTTKIFCAIIAWIGTICRGEKLSTLVNVLFGIWTYECSKFQYKNKKTFLL